MTNNNKIYIPVLLSIFEGSCVHAVDIGPLHRLDKGALYTINEGKPARFSDLVFIHYDGSPVILDSGGSIRFLDIDLSNIDFRDQPISQIEFYRCFFSSDKLGRSELHKVSCAGCRLDRSAAGDLFYTIDGTNLLRLFHRSHEKTDIENPKFGPVFIVDDENILCGCRYHNFEWARKWWQNGSESGGDEFAAKIVALADLKLQDAPTLTQ